MRTTREILVPTQITTYKCDTCDYTTEHNAGRCGVAPIMVCSFCKADNCRDCRSYYNETGGDYDDAIACPKCKDKADICWTIAKDVASRYESIRDVVQNVFNNFETYSHLADPSNSVVRDPTDIMIDIYSNITVKKL